MTTTPHDRTLELLPWLLNGTLDADERREVEAHLASCEDCRSELAATRSAFEVYGAHLPAAALTACAVEPRAAAWTVDGVEVSRERLEAHLAHCAACRDELALLRDGLAALADPEPRAAGEVVPFAPRPAEAAASAAPRWLPLALAASMLFALVTGAGWLTTRQQMDEEQRAAARLQSQLEEARAAVRTSQAQAGSNAASAAQSVAALQGTVADLESQLAELSGKLQQQEQQVADLRAAYDSSPVIATSFLGLVERGSDHEVVADPGSPLVFNVLVRDTDLPFHARPRYRVVDGSGRSRQQGGVELRPARGAFDQAYLPITVHTTDLAAGEYVLEIFDGDDVVDRIPFRVP